MAVTVLPRGPTIEVTRDTKASWKMKLRKSDGTYTDFDGTEGVRFAIVEKIGNVAPIIEASSATEITIDADDDSFTIVVPASSWSGVVLAERESVGEYEVTIYSGGLGGDATEVCRGDCMVFDRLRTTA